MASAKYIIIAILFIMLTACAPKVNPEIVKRCEEAMRFAQLTRELQVKMLACMGVECEDVTGQSKTPIVVWALRQYRGAYNATERGLRIYKECPWAFRNGKELVYQTDYLYETLYDASLYIDQKMLEQGRCARISD